MDMEETPLMTFDMDTTPLVDKDGKIEHPLANPRRFLTTTFY
jgi:hypothetical protein